MSPCRARAYPPAWTRRLLDARSADGHADAGRQARVVGEDAMHALADDDAVPPEVQALLASIQHISVPRPPEAVVEYATSRLVSVPMDVFRERHQLNKNM